LLTCRPSSNGLRVTSNDYGRMLRDHRTVLIALGATLLSGCATYFPTVGPSRSAIEGTAAPPAAAAIQVVDVDDEVTRRLLAQRTRHLFSETLGNRPNELQPVGSGDSLEVFIWEATPATLFGSMAMETHRLPTPTAATALPEQIVDGEGFISVPFAGRVPAAGKTIPEIEAEINRRRGEPDSYCIAARASDLGPLRVRLSPYCKRQRAIVCNATPSRGRGPVSGRSAQWSVPATPPAESIPVAPAR